MPRAKTCLSSGVICTDAIEEISLEARWLYIILGFEADNDGAINGIAKVARSLGFGKKEIAELEEAGYLIAVDGVYFIRHWWVNNNTDSANYREGTHTMERAKLGRDDNRCYYLLNDRQTDERLPSVSNIKEPNEIQPNANEVELNEEEIKQKEKAAAKPETARMEPKAPGASAPALDDAGKKPCTCQDLTETADGLLYCQQCRKLYTLNRECVGQLRAYAPDGSGKYTDFPLDQSNEGDNE